MQKESNFLLMDAKKARHRPSSFVKISDYFLSILESTLPIFIQITRQKDPQLGTPTPHCAETVILAADPIS